VNSLNIPSDAKRIKAVIRIKQPELYQNDSIMRGEPTSRVLHKFVVDSGEYLLLTSTEALSSTSSKISRSFSHLNSKKVLLPVKLL
jgi:hypothetical protein